MLVQLELVGLLQLVKVINLIYRVPLRRIFAYDTYSSRSSCEESVDGSIDVFANSLS